MGDQSFSSKEILLISSGSGVRVVWDLLGIGRVGIFQAAMYLALEPAAVAVAGIYGGR
jgi:hypothetical protein